LPRNDQQARWGHRPLAALKAAKVSSVTINGDTATARVVGAAAPASLRRINGSWKVDALGLDATQATGATSEVATVQARLKAAGFIPEDEGADSSVVGSLRVAGMHIDVYATSDKATVGKHEIDKVFLSATRTRHDAAGRHARVLDRPATHPAPQRTEEVRQARRSRRERMRQPRCLPTTR
jgi:hypothetical protein